MTDTVYRKVTPTAVLHTRADVPRDLWLQARRSGIGSSDVPAILGVDGYGRTALHVYHEKVTGLAEQDIGEAALWGNLLEDPIAREWARRNRAAIQKVGIVSHAQHPWRRATLDRRVVSCPLDRVFGRCMLEVKTRSAWVAGKWSRGLPDDVAAQVCWALAVTGYDHAHVVVLIGGQDYRQYVVGRDLDLEELVVPRVARFWQSHILRRLPPDLPDEYDPERIVELDGALHPSREGAVEVSDDALEALERYERARIAKSAAERAQSVAKVELILALGDREAAITPDSKPVYEYTPTTRRSVDFDRLQQEHPDAYLACVSQVAGRSLSIHPSFRLKAEK